MSLGAGGARALGIVVALAAAGAQGGCLGYRNYPLVALDVIGSRAPMEWSGAAVLPGRELVAAAEGEADALYVPEPAGALGAAGVLDLFPLHDGRDACGSRPTQACADAHSRAGARMRPQAVRWLPREDGITTPYDIEDLAPMGPDLVLGVTEYNTVGRRSGYRRDYVARSRRTTERMFVLQREGDAWQEIRVPTIDRLRDSLSDWGRANCADDMLVEGLAYDPGAQVVYVGLARCEGPSQRVLSYRVADVRYGLASGIEIHADGLAGADAGPEEGISGLSFAAGRLFALTAWDSYGYEHEPAYGGRLHEVRDGKLHALDIPVRFRDRPAALAVLDDGRPDARVEDLDMLVLFDNDLAARSRKRPDATVLRARVPRPSESRWMDVLSLERLPSAQPLGLNGFDLRWYARDHRLAQMAFVLDRLDDGRVGAWVRAIGGRWQMEIGGSLGNAASRLPGKGLGHAKQAVALTDFAAVPGLSFTAYRARLSIIPRDRERDNPSVAALLDSPDYVEEVALPGPASPGAALVLQGLEIDTTSRALHGICVAALQLGVGWASPTRDTVSLQGAIVGGLCNDFDTKGKELRHGNTTSESGGVEAWIHFAVVEGAPAESLVVQAWDRSRPAPRDADGAPTGDPSVALDDAEARAHVHCVALAATGAPSWRKPQPRSPDPAWMQRGLSVRGSTTAGAAALTGITLAFDPSGFDPAAPRTMADTEALARNNYVHRYLVRAFVGPLGTLFEGGMTHGIHRAGLMRDSARTSALLARAELTTFPGMVGARTWDSVSPRRGTDPNLQPEDGFPRWAPGQEPIEGVPCSTPW